MSDLNPNPSLPQSRSPGPSSSEGVTTVQATITFEPDASSATETTTGPLPAIPGYTVLRELGRGGMGVVYQARQSGLDRLVALKMILHADHATEVQRRRFLHEAQALARLKHENIVQVYEVGEFQGKPFFSLEYIEGGSLDRFLHGTPVSPIEAAQLVEPLARAMQAAHDVGVIHRDLKPGNVLLSGEGRGARGERGQQSPQAKETPEGASPPHSPPATRPWPLIPRITDFGLAKQLDLDQAQTRSGQILGTPSYMAPEQASGKSKEIDARADVYALGAILYECLTGRPPFRAATQMETLLQVMHVETVPVRTLQPGVPRDLETICERCLQKEPGRRYQSAASLASELGRFLRGEPIEARPVGRLERGWRWCRRNPVTASLLTTVAFLLIAGTTIAITLALLAHARAEAERRERGQKEEALEDRERALERETRQRERAEGLVYSGQLAQVQQLWQQGNVKSARARLLETDPAARGWEYDYLFNVLHEGARVHVGSMGFLSAVACSPDGRWMAAGGADNRLRVWDFATGAEVWEARSGHNTIASLAWSPDGAWIATAGREGRLQLWDIARRESVATLPGHGKSASHVCFSSDGRTLVSCGDDGAVRLWDLKTRQQTRTITPAGVTVGRAAFSPDGKQLLVATFGNLIRVWDTAAGKELRSLRGSVGLQQHVACSADGRWVASAGGQFALLWEVATGKQWKTLTGHTQPIRGLCFSPDSRYLCTSGSDHSVRLWDVLSGETISILRGHTGTVADVAFHPSGRQLVSVGEDRTLRIWELATTPEAVLLGEMRGLVNAIRFSPDGRLVVATTSTGLLRVWDVHTLAERYHHRLPARTYLQGLAIDPSSRWAVCTGATGEVHCFDIVAGKPLWSCRPGQIAPSSVCFTPDGTEVVVGGKKGELRFLESSSGQEKRALDRPGEFVRVLTFVGPGRLARAQGDQVVIESLDGGGSPVVLRGHTASVTSIAWDRERRIATSSNDRTIRLWDALTGQEVNVLRGHTEEVETVCFGPTGGRLFSGGNDQTIRVWDRDSGQELLTIRGQGSRVQVDLNRDGTQMVSSSWDGQVRLWNAGLSRRVRILQGHLDDINVVAYSPDGQRLLTGSDDKTLGVWDVETGRRLQTLRGHTSRVLAACFSPDRKRAASAGEQGVIRLWDVEKGQEERSYPFSQAATFLAFSEDGTKLVVVQGFGKAGLLDLQTGQETQGIERTTPSTARRPDGRQFAHREGRFVYLFPLGPDGPLEAEAQERQRELARRWHNSQAEETLRLGWWSPAAFHLERHLEDRPDNVHARVQTAYALSRVGQSSSAARHYLHALLLDPHASAWPFDPQAEQRGQIMAESGNWSQALEEFRLGIHQPQPRATAWMNYLLAALAARQPEDYRAGVTLMLSRIDLVNTPDGANLLSAAQLGPCHPGDAEKLLQVARVRAERDRTAANVHRLGAALYRAGKLAEARVALEEAVSLHGRGGLGESILFLSMVQHQLGQKAEARQRLARFELLLRNSNLDGWYSRTLWDVLLREARSVLGT